MNFTEINFTNSGDITFEIELPDDGTIGDCSISVDLLNQLLGENGAAILQKMSELNFIDKAHECIDSGEDAYIERL